MSRLCKLTSIRELSGEFFTNFPVSVRWRKTVQLLKSSFLNETEPEWVRRSKHLFAANFSIGSSSINAWKSKWIKMLGCNADPQEVGRGLSDDHTGRSMQKWSHPGFETQGRHHITTYPPNNYFEKQFFNKFTVNSRSLINIYCLSPEQQVPEVLLQKFPFRKINGTKEILSPVYLSLLSVYCDLILFKSDKMKCQLGKIDAKAAITCFYPRESREFLKLMYRVICWCCLWINGCASAQVCR